MNFSRNYNECYDKWYAQFQNFITETNLELTSQNISIIFEELFLFNKFIFYLWGSNLDETCASMLDTSLDNDNELTLIEYALTFSRGNQISDDNSVTVLIIHRKNQYNGCFSGPPENINFYNFNYNNFIGLAYDNMAKSNYSFFQKFQEKKQFINIYNEILTSHHTFFLKYIGPFFTETKSL